MVAAVVLSMRLVNLSLLPSERLGFWRPAVRAAGFQCCSPQTLRRPIPRQLRFGWEVVVAHHLTTQESLFLLRLQ